MSSKIHGVATTIASLKSKRSSGVGEYLDLLLLLEWLSSVGMNALQILPINDSGNDPSPYNGKSAFALNPLYLRVPGFHWNASSTRVDFPEVMKRKKAALQTYFEREFPHLEKESNYIQFLEEQKGWIFDWAEHNEGTFTLFEQYHCYKQMREVAEFAEKKNILLVGDLPILLAPDSAEVRRFPNLFSKEFVAGAPPDMFTEEGQKWGFPLYQWEALEKDNFQFWKDRVRWARQFFPTFRLDHIVGFFRLWAIPKEGKAINGFYIPDKKEEWLAEGRKILSILVEEMAIPPIGEDLGVIPNEVREVMRDLSIPSMKVVRWERYWEGDKSYIPFSEYPEVSLTTVSTHDTEPLRLWWKNQPEERALFCKFMGWNETPNLDSAKILEILKDAHSTKSKYHINLLLEYLSAFPELSYEDPEEDRINTPGILSSKNWGWRMRPTLEELFYHEELNKTLRSFCS